MKINITTFIIQIINFSILGYILYKVLFRPLRAIMEKRKRLVMVDIDRALQMKEEAMKIKEKYEGLMKGAEEFKKAEAERAVEEAEAARKEIIDKAQKDAAQERSKTEAVIESERKEMLARLKKTAAEISAQLASNLLEKFADQGLHDKLTGMMLKELESQPLYLPRRPGGEGVRAVCATAYCLSERDCKNIESMLRENLGPDVKIEHKVDKELICGLRLWVDGAVLDGSLKGQLNAFKEQAAERTG